MREIFVGLCNTWGFVSAALGRDYRDFAGGAALALGSAGLGLFAYRRYRKTAA
jgi:hypothetical protein